MKTFVAFLLFLGLASGARGEDDSIDEATQTEALGYSQSVLKNPSKRGAASKNPDAAAAMEALEKLAGNPQNSQKMYELAAELMQTLTQLSGGDPQKMMKILEEGKKNPDAFGKQLTPEQRKKLQEIARAIETPSKLH